MQNMFKRSGEISQYMSSLRSETQDGRFWESFDFSWRCLCNERNFCFSWDVSLFKSSWNKIFFGVFGRGLDFIDLCIVANLSKRTCRITKNIVNIFNFFFTNLNGIPLVFYPNKGKIFIGNE